MIKICFFALLMLLPAFVFSQQEGDQWVLGFYGTEDPENSIMFFDFREGNMRIILKPRLTMFIAETAANICDSEGNPVLWTNGMEIFGYEGRVVSDTIAYDDPFGYWPYYYADNFYHKPFGFPMHDGALILPFPDEDGIYSVIYHSAELHPGSYWAISKFLEAKIQVNLDSTYILHYQDSLIGDHLEWYTHRVEAVRHANGRDWWIVMFEENSSRYFCYILNPKGIEFSHSDTTSTAIMGGLGQACFSPGGNYYARMDAITFEEGQFITLYSFDRCSGYFGFLDSMRTEAGYYTGVAFSPSEQYLYANNNEYIWQWDLTDTEIKATQSIIGVYDGFIEPGWFGTHFGSMVLAPDSRIYCLTPNGTSGFLHVINRPNLEAEKCRLKQHSIELPVPTFRSAPNIPNFRLGPLDGSPCDTLGIDNIPVSRWRYEEDEPGWYHDIRFTDLSFYDPQTWFWDFGDGETSDEPSPIHSFEDGLYHVCLTVSNANGTDSTCQWIEILPTGTHDASDSDTDLSISPNPFDTELHIESTSGVFRTASFHLFDMYGRLILHQPEIPIPLKISLPSLPSGMYLCRI